MAHIKQTFKLGDQEVTLEYGEIARQAAASVLVTCNDTTVLVAVTGRRTAVPGATFLPLTVDYQEKYYAAGRIPGSFFRREGRPAEKEILTSRLIDRFLRPLFPAFYYNETQVLATVLSFNPEIDSDVPAMLGAAAAMYISGIPFNGPVGATRVGFVDGNIIVAPTTSQLEKSDLDLVVAGTREGVLMVESEAKELSEETMLAAVSAGQNAIQPVMDAIVEMGEKIGNPRWEWSAPELSEEKKTRLWKIAEPRFETAYNIVDKQERSRELDDIRDAARAETLDAASPPVESNIVSSLLKKIEAKIVRGRILDGGARIDGRKTDDVRDITVRVGVLPRAHGSALFTRGETQALAVVTLGGDRDDQKIDALPGEQFDAFMVHYNFPPFATGETGRVLSPKRREIGHGRLAKRGLKAVVPSRDDCGFTIRLVSEIMESNGSSSMASVCGGSLALMDAGVPLSAPVSGIAMGLIKDGEKYAVLSDILGDEDHLGDMDFKVAGSEKGVTALQMDLKISNINEEIMGIALKQARDGRMYILGVMNEKLSSARQDLSSYAPRLLKMKISVSKIRDVIGKGGSVIRNLTETTETRIDVAEDGSITITGANMESCKKAKEKIETLTMELEVGRIYDGKVEKVLENVGAIVSIFPGRDGLLHVSQISRDSRERVRHVSDHLEVGQSIRVKVIQSDDGRVRFSLRDVEAE